jgi:hypothetical protein
MSGQHHSLFALPVCIRDWLCPRAHLDLQEERKMCLCQESNTDSLLIQPLA